MSIALRKITKESGTADRGLDTQFWDWLDLPVLLPSAITVVMVDLIWDTEDGAAIAEDAETGALTGTAGVLTETAGTIHAMAILAATTTDTATSTAINMDGITVDGTTDGTIMAGTTTGITIILGHIRSPG